MKYINALKIELNKCGLFECALTLNRKSTKPKLGDAIDR